MITVGGEDSLFEGSFPISFISNHHLFPFVALDLFLFFFFSLDNGKLRPIDGTCKKICTFKDEDENETLCGETGVTTATIVFSCLLGISVLGLICYHIVYVTYILPKKKEEEEGYERLLN